MHTYHKFRLICLYDCGWGQTGSIAEMCAEGSKEQATDFVKNNIPGSWKIENYLGLTTDTFYLNHISKEALKKI